MYRTRFQEYRTCLYCHHRKTLSSQSVTIFSEPERPLVGAAAGFHGDDVRGLLGDESAQTRSRAFPAQPPSDGQLHRPPYRWKLRLAKSIPANLIGYASLVWVMAVLRSLGITVAATEPSVCPPPTRRISGADHPIILGLQGAKMTALGEPD